ncbi:MAG: hypothetical protein R3Y58_04835 [Eubacteriales bacterium]
MVRTKEKGKTANDNQTPVQKARNGIFGGAVFGGVLTVTAIFIFFDME